jgi:hypothetical protein
MDLQRAMNRLTRGYLDSLLNSFIVFEQGYYGKKDARLRRSVVVSAPLTALASRSGGT